MSASIEFSHVTFNYGFRHSPALTDISFDIDPGSIAGLLGRNGSGKSTIAMLMAGQARAQEGDVLFNGVPVFDNPEAMANV